MKSFIAILVLACTAAAIPAPQAASNVDSRAEVLPSCKCYYNVGTFDSVLGPYTISGPNNSGTDWCSAAKCTGGLIDASTVNPGASGTILECTCVAGCPAANAAGYFDASANKCI